MSDRLKSAQLALQAVHTAVTAVLDLFMAWQVAKMVCPELTVHEEIARTKARKFLGKCRPQQVSQRQADEFVAQVTQYVREREA